MFYDLHTPFPSSSSSTQASSSSNAKQPSKKQQKKTAGSGAGQASGDDWRKKQADEEEQRRRRDCWFGVPTEEREKSEGGVRMARHLGYSVLGFTQTAHSKIDAQTHYNPFHNSSRVPYPQLDPRHAPKGTNLGGRGLVQLSRLHLILDDGSLGTGGCGFLAQNTNLLSQYDILSVQPTTLQTFILACLTLSVPGPNQISIITLDFSTSSRIPFHLKRKPVLQALRAGVVFEILYSPLLPSPHASSSSAPSMARQTTLSTANDLVRITRGKGIIISSGGDGGWGGLRGSADVVNLGTMMGLKPNMAYAAVVLTPKKVVLRAQARKTFRGLISTPRIVVDVSETEAEDPAVEVGAAEAMVVG